MVLRAEINLSELPFPLGIKKLGNSCVYNIGVVF